MEDPEVFETAHQLLFRLIGEGFVTGLRIDHPDGLLDPLGYAARLQARIGVLLYGEHVPAPPPGAPARPFYLTVEKILATGEPLPSHWAVHGTTTYRFLNLVNSVFVDPRGARTLRRMHTRLTNRRESFADLVYQCKRLIMSTSMASELSVLAHAVNDLSESDRRSRDFTLNGLRKALMEVIACLPAYRTYVTTSRIDDRDRRVVETAIAEARRRNPALEVTIFDFLRQVMLPEPRGDDDVDPAGAERRLAFAMKLQQYTGPVYAKGVEDTAFYRHHVLVSLNEVGGDPSQFGRDVDAFHFANAHRLERWPLEMIGTATHDTKRGEDTRARINVISEMPDTWRRVVSRWMRINASARTAVNGVPAPDRADEYFFYQTLVGVWPALSPDAPTPTDAPADLVARLTAYMQKAIKEAKVHTSWVSQDDAYERAMRRFVEQALTGRTASTFLASFIAFERRIEIVGAVNGLAQLVLKLTSPGVVDLYQGSELWDLSLVDPDNRGPVDFAKRRALLDSLEPLLASANAAERAGGVRELLRHWRDGQIKLFVTAALLRARRDHGAVWLEGDYVPLWGATDADRRHLVAFARRLGRETMITVAPRLVDGLLPAHSGLPLAAELWQDAAIELPPELPDVFTNVITGERVEAVADGERRLLRAADILGACPVAVLQHTQS
jgi:(1->4)-alpha-D-glucan 1-alpha-D-glucosylmutase